MPAQDARGLGMAAVAEKQLSGEDKAVPARDAGRHAQKERHAKDVMVWDGVSHLPLYMAMCLQPAGPAGRLRTG